MMQFNADHTYSKSAPEGGEGSSQRGAEELDEGEDDDGQRQDALHRSEEREQGQAAPMVAQSQAHFVSLLVCFC